MFPNVAQKVSTAVFTQEWGFSTLPKKLPIIWAIFVRNCNCQELSKLAQSGHAECDILFHQNKIATTEFGLFGLHLGHGGL